MASDSEALPDLAKILGEALERSATDVYLAVGSAPRFRIKGDLVAMEAKPLDRDECKRLVFRVMTEAQVDALERHGQLRFSIGFKGLCRARVTVVMQQGVHDVALRVLPMQAKTIEQLGFAPVAAQAMTELATLSSGLVLVAGGRTSGKSTTLAALVEHRNATLARRLLTLEAPIELLFRDTNSLVAQVEIGHDVDSFESALRFAQHQDCDAVMISRLVGPEATRLALELAEGGRLVLAGCDAVSLSTLISSLRRPELGERLAQSLAGVILTRCEQGQFSAGVLKVSDSLQQSFRDGVVK